MEIEKNKKQNDKSNRWQIYKIIITGAVIGLFAIFFYTIYKYQIEHSISTFFLWSSVSATISLACSSIGFLIGFLFGVPHLGTKKDPEANIYSTNTSLEQISDWLTKILIGLGLTQLTKIPNYLFLISHKIVTGINCEHECPQEDTTFIIFLILFYLVLGFFFGYFFSRLELLQRFVDADLYNKSQNKLKEEVDRNVELVSHFPKENLKKILSNYQKEILIEIINNGKYTIPHKVQSFDEFMDLKKLYNYKIIKVIEIDNQLSSGNTIEFSDDFKDLKIGDIK